MKVGQRIDRFEVEALIGRGAVATVYRVRHAELGRVYALKVLHAGSRNVRDRLMTEARAQAGMRHRNVVAVIDLIDMDGDVGVVMEYVDGPPLDVWLITEDPTVEQSIDLFRSIVRGVGYAHRQGWVHRDLKPANVLVHVTDEGLVPKVCDFGLVKLIQGDALHSGWTESGVAMGTPGYMAPEQIRDASLVDHRADLFSLGCILYELVCGQRAFPGHEMLTVFNKVVAGEYEAPGAVVPDLPPGVQEMIRMLLAVDLEQRVPDCAALLDLLNRDDLLAPGSIDLAEPEVAPNFGSIEAAMSVFRPGMATWWGKLRPNRVQSLVLVAGTALTVAALWFGATGRQGTADPLSETTAGAGTTTIETNKVPVVVDDLTDSADEDALGDGDQAISPSDDPAVTEPSDGDPTVTPDPRPRASSAASPSVPPPDLKDVKRRSGARSDDPVRVTHTGDARDVWLMSGRKRYHLPGEVPPGGYSIVVRFEDFEWVTAGRIRVKGDERIVIDCDRSELRCR